MKGSIYFYFVLALILGSGCASTERTAVSPEAASALKSVATAVAGQEVSDQELNDLAEQIEKDPEAQSAVKAITGDVATTPPQVKYCPVGGERYSSKLVACPVHGVPLREVE